MQQIIFYLLKKKSVLFFIFLMGVSLVLTIQAHRYHKSKFISAANNVTGGLYESLNHVNEFINLDTYNDRLLKENARLRKELENANFYKTGNDLTKVPYEFVPAKLIHNSVHKKNNILVINKGANHGVSVDMGVITTNGIVGIIESVGDNFSTVLSVLHTKSLINVQLKKTNHIGSLLWNGKSPFTLQIEDITKVAPIKKNDTIVTGNYSIFPQGINVGKVKKAKLNLTQNYFDVDIELFNDMSNIGYVYVVKNNTLKEVNELLNNEPNE
jgi:rod shape-determining protein MreC